MLVLADLEVRAGDLVVADAYAREQLQLALGAELSNAEVAARWACALVDAHLGRTDSARAHAERGRHLAAELGDTYRGAHHDQVLGFLELSLGNGAEALGWLAARCCLAR